MADAVGLVVPVDSAAGRAVVAADLAGRLKAPVERLSRSSWISKMESQQFPT